jgi:hypothetical protein
VRRAAPLPRVSLAPPRGSGGCPSAGWLGRPRRRPARRTRSRPPPSRVHPLLSAPRAQTTSAPDDLELWGGADNGHFALAHQLDITFRRALRTGRVLAYMPELLGAGAGGTDAARFAAEVRVKASQLAVAPSTDVLHPAVFCPVPRALLFCTGLLDAGGQRVYGLITRSAPVTPPDALVSNRGRLTVAGVCADWRSSEWAFAYALSAVDLADPHSATWPAVHASLAASMAPSVVALLVMAADLGPDVAAAVGVGVAAAAVTTTAVAAAATTAAVGGGGGGDDDVFKPAPPAGDSGGPAPPHPAAPGATPSSTSALSSFASSPLQSPASTQSSSVSSGPRPLTVDGSSAVASPRDVPGQAVGPSSHTGGGAGGGGLPAGLWASKADDDLPVTVTTTGAATNTAATAAMTTASTAAQGAAAGSGAQLDDGFTAHSSASASGGWGWGGGSGWSPMAAAGPSPISTRSGRASSLGGATFGSSSGGEHVALAAPAAGGSTGPAAVGRKLDDSGSSDARSIIGRGAVSRHSEPAEDDGAADALTLDERLRALGLSGLDDEQHDDGGRGYGGGGGGESFAGGGVAAPAAAAFPVAAPTAHVSAPLAAAASAGAAAAALESVGAGRPAALQLPPHIVATLLEPLSRPHQPPPPTFHAHPRQLVYDPALPLLPRYSSLVRLRAEEELLRAAVPPAALERLEPGGVPLRERPGHCLRAAVEWLHGRVPLDPRLLVPGYCGVTRRVALLAPLPLDLATAPPPLPARGGAAGGVSGGGGNFTTAASRMSAQICATAPAPVCPTGGFPAVHLAAACYLAADGVSGYEVTRLLPLHVAHMQARLMGVVSAPWLKGLARGAPLYVTLRAPDGSRAVAPNASLPPLRPCITGTMPLPLPPPAAVPAAVASDGGAGAVAGGEDAAAAPLAPAAADSGFRSQQQSPHHHQPPLSRSDSVGTAHTSAAPGGDSGHSRQSTPRDSASVASGASVCGRHAGPSVPSPSRGLLEARSTPPPPQPPPTWGGGGGSIGDGSWVSPMSAATGPAGGSSGGGADDYYYGDDQSSNSSSAGVGGGAGSQYFHGGGGGGGGSGSNSSFASPHGPAPHQRAGSRRGGAGARGGGGGARPSPPGYGSGGGGGFGGGMSSGHGGDAHQYHGYPQQQQQYQQPLQPQQHPSPPSQRFQPPLPQQPQQQQQAAYEHQYAAFGEQQAYGHIAPPPAPSLPSTEPQQQLYSQQPQQQPYSQQAPFFQQPQPQYQQAARAGFGGDGGAQWHAQAALQPPPVPQQPPPAQQPQPLAPVYGAPLAGYGGGDGGDVGYSSVPSYAPSYAPPPPPPQPQPHYQQQQQQQQLLHQPVPPQAPPYQQAPPPPQQQQQQPFPNNNNHYHY